MLHICRLPLAFFILCFAWSGETETVAQTKREVPIAPTTASSAPGKPSANTVAGPGGHVIIAQGEAGQLTFRRVAGSGTGGSVVNINLPFSTDRLPATFSATMVSGENCTSTLIGPRVLLTAAHCLDRKTRDLDGRWQTYGGVLRSGKSGDQVLATIRRCEMAPAYIATDPQPGRPRNEKDFALCELWSPVTGIVAETIDLDAAVVASGQQLMIVGYGCTNSDLVGGTITVSTLNKGRLTVGMNAVGSGGPAGWLALPGTVGSTQAILCPGDSGGGAFAKASLEPGTGNDAGRRIVAINSAVGPAANGAAADYVSYLAPLADPTFQTFLTTWVAAQPERRAICGHDPKLLAGCRR